MINYTEATIKQIIVHRVGNQSKDDGIIISTESPPIEEGMAEILTHYFLKPFTKVSETFQFVQREAPTTNRVQMITQQMFEQASLFYGSSISLLEHLYAQSNHPHIKSGDLFIIHFKDILLGDELTDAIGIFKAESKEDFLKVGQEASKVWVKKEKGIGLRKLDKGALILQSALDDGAKVLSVDNNSYDTEYWLYRFLDVEYIRDNNFTTRTYMEMCQSFAKEVIKEEKGKKEQLDFLNQSIQYFDTNERANTEDFGKILFEQEPEKEQNFKAYVANYETDNGVELSDTFLISKSALQKQKKTIKNAIQLDTNIQIKLDFKNPESSRHFLEKGYDEQRDMYYYKVYYNEELD